MTDTIGYLLMCLFATHVSFFRKMWIRALCSFFNWIIFLLLRSKYSLFILNIIPWSNIYIANIFSHYVVYLFIFFTVSFEAPKFSFLILLSLSFFFFKGHTMAYGSSQARGRIGTTAASLCHSHSHTGSEACLRITPQLRAMPDPKPTEWRQGLSPEH